MAKAGRKPSGRYNCSEMVEAIEDYLQECLRKKKVPIFKEVSVKMGWNYHTVMVIRAKEEYKDLDEELYRLQDAKEYMLERLGLDGKIDKTMAVFSLKQLGWKDQQVLEFESGKETGLNITLKIAE